jgi:hypothetical protein
MMIRGLLKVVPCLLLVALIALTAPAPARAGLDIEFSAGIQLNDDTDLFLAINSRYFGQDTKVVRTYAARYTNHDDLAVSLFIGKRSGRSADHIFWLRRQGLSWFDISVQLGVPVDVWFVDVRRNPGPPYGKAYGHWKNHKKNRARVVLTDADLRNLVAVRMIHEYYRLPVEAAMDLRASGQPLHTILSTEYHKRHGEPGGKPAKGHPGKGHGKKK